VTAGIAAEQGGGLVLAGPNVQVVHTLRECGNLNTIPTYRTVQAALDGDDADLITEPDAPPAPTPWPMNRTDRRTA
jgi:hypothetical protein